MKWTAGLIVNDRLNWVRVIRSPSSDAPLRGVLVLVPGSNGDGRAMAQDTVWQAFAVKNQLAITANSPDVGEARETMSVNYKGKDLAIAFNPAYLIEPLNALAEDEVFIELIDELSPGVLKINGPFLYVVMPMRLS